MKSFPFLLLAAVLFVSCGDNSSAESSYVPLKQVIGTQTPTTTSTTPSFVTDTSVHLTPGEPVTVTPNNASVKLNPPHGQPGHRCDIPDGAPLPSTQPVNVPQLQPQPQTQIQPQPVTQIQPTVVSTQTKTPKGMNPPHGEPGHRCDIAVGAPLNSKPTTTTTTQPTVSTTPTKTAPGMNPPHGEAGHRCDIAVGAPLPKTDAKTEAKNEGTAIIPVKNEVKDSTKQ